MSFSGPNSNLNAYVNWEQIVGVPLLKSLWSRVIESLRKRRPFYIEIGRRLRQSPKNETIAKFDIVFLKGREYKRKHEYSLQKYDRKRGKNAIVKNVQNLWVKSARNTIWNQFNCFSGAPLNPVFECVWVCGLCSSENMLVASSLTVRKSNERFVKINVCGSLKFC